MRKLHGHTPEEIERRKAQSAAALEESNGKVLRKHGLSHDTSKVVHFEKKDEKTKTVYFTVKFTHKDMTEIDALIEDLQTNVGLRDVSAADLLMMLVNRYRYQRSTYKDKTQL